MTTQIQPRSVTGTILKVVDGKVTFQQTRPKLDREVSQFTHPRSLAQEIEERYLNKALSITLIVDKLKADRVDDGRIGSYWWLISDVTPIDAPLYPVPNYSPEPVEELFRDVIHTTGASDGGNGVNPAALGSCANHAVDFVVSGICPLPEGRELVGWIRELRDRFYRDINQAPLAPLHYCYAHNQDRQQGPGGNWGHLIPTTGEEKAYCIEGREGWRVFTGMEQG